MSVLKEYLRTMATPKKVLWLFFVIGAPVLTAILMIWVFSLHGSYGLFIWFPVFTYIVIILIIFATIGPLLILLDVLRENKEIRSSVKKIAWVFCLICLIVPITFLCYIGTSLNHPAGDTAPQLLVIDGTGKNDIPDMAVTYWTQAKSKDSLKWGEGALTDTIKEEKATNSHVFVLDDLEPDTEYYYEINGGGKIHKFTTFPATDDTLRFAVTSDPHFGRSESRNDITIEILEQITDSGKNFDIFFMLGDFVEYGFDDYQWQEGLDAISPYTTKIPFRPVIGNHDTILGGKKYYLDYFYPAKMPLDTGSRLWYRIDINNIHFFILDLEWGTETYTAKQKEWFEEEIDNIDKDDWTIVMSHCFFYSSGNIDGGRSWSDQKPMIDAFEDLFIKNDVDLVFSGHNHHAEILKKDGIYYQIVGTFGAHPDRKAAIESDSSEWYMNIEDDDDFGFFEVDINGNTATLNFRNRDYDSLKQIVVEQ